MKFYFTVVMAAMLMAVTANSQHANIGIKAGLNVYNINNDNSSEYDPKAGFHAGLIGHIHLTKQWALQPEIVYSAQGAKYTNAGVDTKLNLGYINLPVMVQYMFDNGFRLQAGPQLGFLVNAESKSNEFSTDIKDNLQTVDLALGFGGGYVNPATGLGIDLRYNVGLSNINESGSVKSTNQGFQVGLFYLFKHK